MSFVVPRPLSVKYLPYYTEEERRRHDVRPGLTGLAQINGRNMLSWEDRFIYDCRYSHKITFFDDTKILYLTISKVFRREGIAVRGTGDIQDFHTYRLSQQSHNFES